MKEYDFRLIFKLNYKKENLETDLDRLYEAGCDDAIVGVGKEGYLALDFIRESNSGHEAIATAVENVNQVFKEAKLTQVSPDLVGIKDLASIFKCSRQNIQRNAIKSDFPNPVYNGAQAIWHLATVLNWFVLNNYQVDPERLEIAELAMSINAEIAAQTAQPKLLDRAKILAAI